jgi:hypothetical protein
LRTAPVSAESLAPSGFAVVLLSPQPHGATVLSTQIATITSRIVSFFLHP